MLYKQGQDVILANLIVSSFPLASFNKNGSHLRKLPLQTLMNRSLDFFKNQTLLMNSELL